MTTTPEDSSIDAYIQSIDAVLPQTQCGECGYSGCLPYAKALALSETSIDRCPPGGVETLNALGTILHIDKAPYLETVRAQTRAPATAFIREEDCIGCTKCIQACPVDAIVGRAKFLHTVLTHECTGCGLCVTPCPVDCIEIHPLEKPAYTPEMARARYKARLTRHKQERMEKQRLVQRRQIETKQEAARKTKQTYILEALARKQSSKKDRS